MLSNPSHHSTGCRYSCTATYSLGLHNTHLKYKMSIAHVSAALITICLCHPTGTLLLCLYYSSILLSNLLLIMHIATCTCMLKDLGTLSISSLKKFVSYLRASLARAPKRRCLEQNRLLLESCNIPSPGMPRKVSF